MSELERVDYQQLSLDELAEMANSQYELSLSSFKWSVQHALAAGQALNEAKSRLEHGEWLPWVAAKIRYPERTARRYMLVAKSAIVADLPEDAGILALERAAGSLGGLKSSVHVQWYTPADYIGAARQVMGGLDLDPASSELANETIQAPVYYDEHTDGLTQDWHGKVWLNPPYGKGSGLFATKLVQEYAAGRVKSAVLLLNAYGFDSSWFQPLWDHPICFTNHRVQFTNPDRETGGPANANIFVYLGPNRRGFIDTFTKFGAVVERAT